MDSEHSRYPNYCPACNWQDGQQAQRTKVRPLLATQSKRIKELEDALRNIKDDEALRPREKGEAMLKTYMGYCAKATPQDGACLIFAHNIREAKPIAYHFNRDSFDCEYTCSRVALLKNNPWLFEQVDEWVKEKIAKDEAVGTDDPPTCDLCELWGEKLDERGICTVCREEEVKYDTRL